MSPEKRSSRATSSARIRPSRVSIETAMATNFTVVQMACQKTASP